MEEIKVIKVKPMFNQLVTTMSRYEEDTVEGSIITNKRGTLKEIQKVIAVGSAVRDLKEGDLVCINPTRYAVHKHNEGSIKNDIIGDNPVINYRFNIIELNHIPHLLLYDNDIKYKVEEYEMEKQEENFPHVILPPTKEFLV